MAKSKKKKGGAKKAETKKTTQSKPMLKIVVIAVVILGGLSAAGYWFMQPRGDLNKLPAIDVATMEPLVGKKLNSLLKGVQDSPDNAQAWGLLGMNFQVHGFAREAFDCLEQAHKLDPSAFAWAYYFALGKRDLGEPEALDWFLKAAELNPNHAPLHVHLGEMYLKLNRKKEAEQSFLKALGLNPGLSHAHLGLAKIARMENRLDAAIKHLETGLRQTRRHREIIALLMNLYRETGQTEKWAQLSAQFASQLDRLPPKAKMNDPFITRFAQEGVSQLWFRERGQVFYDAGEFQNALKEFQSALQIRNDARTQHNIGLCYMSMNSLKPAIQHLKAAVEKAPHKVTYLNDLGDAMLKADDAAGEKYLREALEKKPYEALVVATLGKYLQGQKRWRDLIAIYEKAYELRPNHPIFQRDLAWFLTVAPQAPTRKPKKALGIIEKILAEDGVVRPDLYELFSVVYAANGRFQDALTYSGYAITRAQRRNNPQLVKELQQRHALFQRGQAWVMTD